MRSRKGIKRIEKGGTYLTDKERREQDTVQLSIYQSLPPTETDRVAHVTS